MRFLFSSSLLLFLCLTARAQTPTTPEKPKDFAFDFSTSTNKSKVTGKSVTESQFGFSRMLSTGNQVTFDKAVSGTAGFLKSESITFLDKNGKELAQLNSAFLPDGKLKSQTLAPKGKPVQVLSWYKTKPQSPDIQVPNSVVRVRYSILQGFLKQRVLAFTLPTETRQFVTNYDAKGRRAQDSSASKDGIMKLNYSYGPLGMTRLINAASKTESEKDISLSYLKNGDFDSMVMKADGVINARMTMLYKSVGNGIGQRMESYENGILATTMTLNNDLKTAIQEDYDASGNSIIKKAGFSVGKERILNYEELWSNGKVAERMDYAPDGRPIKRTVYNADGTVKSVETANEGAAPATQ